MLAIYGFGGARVERYGNLAWCILNFIGPIQRDESHFMVECAVVVNGVLRKPKRFPDLLKRGET